MNTYPYRNTALMTATALALALAAPAASAQDYNTGNTRTVSNENVEVGAPRAHVTRGHFGMPLEKVSMSQPVRYDDLDLRTPWGARALEIRIRAAARSVCGQLDAVVPYAMPDSPSCYQSAVDIGMHQANDAIVDARDYAD